MASGPVDVLEPLEAEETGKKKSKFQTFKNFFAKKKKKKESSSLGAESTLKPSQSSSDVSAPHLDSSPLHLPTEPGSRGSMGNKALSHDSVFVSDVSPDMAGKTSSQENLPGKVKALQLQFQHTLQLRSPPLMIASKKTEDAGAVSEDDGLPRSPPEISTLHDVLTCSTSKSSNPVQRHSSLSLGGTDSEDDQEPSEASSKTVSPLSPSALLSPILPTCHLLSVDFNTPASPVGCLDTSAARHKIALNPRKQKVFNNKTQTMAMVKLEKEQCLLKGAAGKASHPKLREEANRSEEDWKGSSVQNTNPLKESQINTAVPKTKISNPLRYSWNFLPGPGGICISTPESGYVIEAEFQDDNVAVSCPKAEPSLAATELKMEEEGVTITPYQTDGLEQNPQSAGKEEFQISEPLQVGTDAIVLRDVLLPASRSHGMEKDFDSPAECTYVQCPKLVHQKAKGFGNGCNTTAQESPDGGKSCVALGVGSQLCVPPFSSPASETSSEVGKSIVPQIEESPTIKDDAANVDSQSLEDCMKPTVSPQEDWAMLDISLDGTLDEKLYFPAELCCSALNSALGSQQTELLKRACDSTVKDEITCRFAEVASESTPPNEEAREDQPDSMKLKEESKSSDEIVKTQLKSSCTKPVRFTIAPAWQRSLSGGSNSLDVSCPRSSPSSPVKPEFFEGIPDTTTPGCIPNSLERFSGNNRNAATIEWTKAKEEPQSCEGPFGIKLRRTSSMLKYQTEKHHELPKPGPLVVSNTSSAKDEPKLLEFEKPLQDITSSDKSLVMKSSFQEEKNASKAKSEEVTAKQEMSRLPEKTPLTSLEIPPSEPYWISVAKLKQKGFQGLHFSEEPKREEKTFTQTEPEEEKNVGNKQPEKQPDACNEKSNTPTVCAHENRVQRKMPTSSPTAPIEMVSQEAACVEKEKRVLPSLPVSMCSSAEPPWLSLAKKKAKAWSEMPQMVQ